MTDFSDSDPVSENSYVTLHYRVAIEEGPEVASTFGIGPATIQMGAGQLSANLEKCLIGMRAGEEGYWQLKPEEAFGASHPMLVQTLPRSAFPPDVDWSVGQIVRWVSETGVPYAGILCHLDEASARVDFNHPLAGKTIVFDVLIIGVI